MESSDMLAAIRDLAESTLTIAPQVPEICLRLANMILKLDQDLKAGTAAMPADWHHEIAQPDPVTAAMIDYEEAKEILDTVRRLDLIQQKRAARLRASYEG